MVWRLAPESVRKKFSSCQVSCFGLVLSFLGFSSTSFCSHVFRDFVKVFFCCFVPLCFFVFLFLLLFFSPPPRLGAGPGLLSFFSFSFCCLQACDVDRQERCCIASIFSFSVFSLPGPAPLARSLFPSLSLSLSLSLYPSLFSLSFFECRGLVAKRSQHCCLLIFRCRLFISLRCRSPKVLNRTVNAWPIAP